MKKHTNKNLRRGLALFMTVLMMLSCFTAGFSVISFAVGASTPLLGRYFSTSDPWYDAVTNNTSGLGWVSGGYPSYDAATGFTHPATDTYLKINNTGLFSGVSASTGLTVAFTYKPNAGGNYRHLLSFGANDASNIRNHFYISSNPSHIGGGTQVPVVGYVDSNGYEHINAYPSNGPAFATGQTYDVIISFTATEIKYYINGVFYSATCDADSATYLTQFLNEVSGYQNNFIGRSRWGDSNFDGYVKDLRIYGAPLLDDDYVSATAAPYDASTVPAKLSAGANSFTNDAYHYNVVATDGYSNIVYAARNNTVVAKTTLGSPCVYYVIQMPGSSVLVYTADTDELSLPIQVSIRGLNKGNVSNQGVRSIRITENTSASFVLNDDWQGYGEGTSGNEEDYDWAKDTIATTASFPSYYTDSGYVEMRNWNTPRSFWNKLYFDGTFGANEYAKYQNSIGFTTISKYKSGLTDNQTETDSSIANNSFNYYVINYKPVYDYLDEALRCYNELQANESIYTAESVAAAKETIAAIIASNPNGFDYTNPALGVSQCSIMISNAVDMINSVGFTDANNYGLVKKTGTITFVDENGTTLQTQTANYGDTITIIDVPTKASTAEYDYTNPVWVPAATPGTAVMSDTYNQTFTATYTPVKRSYTITWRNVDHTKIDTTTVLYGDTPNHATPTVPASYDTEHYTYAFTGWTPEVAAVTGDATYTATFSATPNNYTITWQYEDGTLIDTTSVAYGTMPTHADPALPASADTDHYTYAFTGWTPEIDVVSGTATYTATFSETPNNYTITWYNADGSLIDTTTVPYNGTPAHATPSVPASYDTTHYTYTFDGWNPSLETVTGDAEYTAQFTQTAKNYTVKFFDLDNVQIGSDQNVAYGGSAAAPDLPTKAADATYHYAVAWNTNAWQNVQGDVNVYAVATGTVHTFGETSYAWTGYTACSATRACACGYSETANATITSEVDPAPTCSATGLKTYTATFAEDWAETKTETERLAIDENAHYYLDSYNEIIRPVKDATTGEWGKGTLVYYCINTIVLDDVTEEIIGRDETHDKRVEVDRADYTEYDAFLADYEAIKALDLNLDYEIEDEDEEYTLGEILGEIEEILADIPQDYVVPEQDNLDELVPDLLDFINEFNSLIDEIGDDAYNHYEIKFVNTDGTVLDTQSLKKGDAVVYGGDDPVCPDNNAQYTYAFTGWTPEIVAVEADATYTATYSSEGTTNSYTITWVDAGDPETTTVAYGVVPTHDLPTRDDDEYYTYSFAWDNEPVAVTGDATYTAVQSKTWNEAKQAIINAADAIIADANDPDTGDDYDPDYIDAIEDLLDIFNDETKTDEERKEALDDLEELTEAADQHKYYTITFVTDGSAVTAITELYGTEVTLPDSEKDGFLFEGWYADSAYAADSKVTNPYTLTGDVTLYAYFEALSLSSEAVEEAIATATAGVSGTCYTAATYEAYQSALAAVRAFKDQPATTENLTAYNNALSDLDAAVAALVVEHAYTGDPTLTRPVKDADTGEWGTGTYTWTCANDAGHPVKTEPVNRANYTQYDAVLAQINTLLEEDYTDNVISALTTAKTAMEAIQQDYVVPEQAQLDAAIQAILNTLGENDKITVNEDGVITVSDDAYKTYTLTVSNNVNSSTLTYTKKAGEQVVLTLTLAGYTFKSWSENANLNAETGVYTFPAADDTITAQYVKNLTSNETIAAAQAIITDANDPDTGSDYDGDYIDDLEDLLDELDVIKNDPTKLDDVEELLEDIQELVNAADSNKLYTITWVIDGATETTKVKVGDTPTHAAPTKEGYHFTGWDPAIVAVTGDATYTAQFEENATGDADYEEYDTLFAILEVLKDNDAILPDLLEQINDKVDNPLPRDLTADQQDTIDAEVEAIKALLDQIVEKDGNGDYTTSVKESALVHCTVTFYWLTTKLTKTVIKGDPVAAPNVTAMYGVEGMESGHYVFDKWTIKGSDSTDFDLESIAGDLELEGHYKLEAHTGSWVEHPATCSSVSWHEIDCTTCGMHFKANTGTEKAPHDWNDWVVVEATCAHPGSRTRTCQNDPSHKETEVIPQLNHTDADGDTICDVCGNPTENHQHTDANGDGKCDTCGAKTNVHAHTDGNNDGVCDGCGSNMDGSFRCNLCSFWEQYKGVPVFGWFVIIIHYIYHLIAQITSWR